MGPDALFLLAVIGLAFLLLSTRADLSVLSLLALANWHVGGQFIAETGELLAQAPWYAYAGVELVLRLGLVVAAIVLLRRRARGGIIMRFSLTVFLSVLLVLFVGQVLSGYPQVQFVDSFISRLLLQFSGWLQAGLLLVALFQYAETSHPSKRKAKR